MAQFRPRPIDIDLQMPVVIQNESELEEEHQVPQPDTHSTPPPTNHPIPIPVYKVVKDSDQHDWRRPDYYIKYTGIVSPQPSHLLHFLPYLRIMSL